MNAPLYGRTFSARVGRVFSNMSITAAIICALSVLGVVLAAFYMLFMILFVFAAVVLTLGIILVYYPNIFSLIRIDEADSVIHFLAEKVAPPSAVVAMAAGALSLAFLILGEPKKNVGRIVFSAIVTAFGVVAAIALLSAGK